VKIASVAEVKAQFSAYLKESEKGVVIVTRNGRPVAALLAVQDDEEARGLPASELLQKAVRAELRRQELLAETDRYVADLVAEVRPPTEAQRTRAATVARRLAQPTRRVD